MLSSFFLYKKEILTAQKFTHPGCIIIGRNCVRGGAKFSLDYIANDINLQNEEEDLDRGKPKYDSIGVVRAFSCNIST